MNLFLVLFGILFVSYAKSTAFNNIIDIHVEKSPNASFYEKKHVPFVGDKFIITCTSRDSNRYHIKLVFRSIFQNNMFVHTLNESFTIADVKSSHSGFYTCMYPDNSTSARFIRVNNVTKPYLSDNTLVFRVASNQRFYLRCPIAGYPIPDYTWYHGVSYAEKLNVSSSTLRVSNDDLARDFMFRCVARNRAGFLEQIIDTQKFLIIHNLGESSIWPISIVCGVLIAVIISLLAVVIWLRYARTDQDRESIKTQRERSVTWNVALSDSALRGNVLECDNNSMYDTAARNSRARNVNDSDLVDFRPLSSGQFGVVTLKLLRKSETTFTQVAVKCVKDSRTQKQHEILVRERAFMESIGLHPNILTLIGVSVQGNTLKLVLEYCEHGSLKDYLQNNLSELFHELEPPTVLLERNGVPSDYLEHSMIPSTSDSADANKARATSHLLQYVWQIANGMDFLARLPCVHRDLAARNLLLNARGAVRIADFGLARNLLDKDYYEIQTPNTPLPFKWMAIELFGDSTKFTQASDVWSFGVVLWEIFTLGASPYASFPTIYSDFGDYLKDGHRLDRPKYAQAEMYELMVSCWHSDPTERPSFDSCKESIETVLKEANPELCASLPTLLQSEAVIQYQYFRKQ